MSEVIAPAELHKVGPGFVRIHYFSLILVSESSKLGLQSVMIQNV